MVPKRRSRGPSPLYRLLQHSLMALACPAAVLAQPCNQGLPTGNLTGVLNTYYPGAVGTAAAGSTSITVDTTAIRGASTTPDIVAGDMLLVIQMQDAEFNQVNSVDYGDGAGGLTGAGSTALNNSGRYEYVEAEGPVSGAGVITIRGANIQPGPVYGLLNSYTTAPRDDEGGTRRGQRTFQVVRVARRASGTLTAGLAVSTWNGRTGGVLAVDVAGDLALGGVTVSVDGTGFRGGVGISQAGDGSLDNDDYMTLDSDSGHGRKAEGIACTPDPLGQVPAGGSPGNDGCPRGDRARGAAGNAGGGGTDGNPDGGNDENSGGGGGGNGGTGGLGGNSWNSNLAIGGRGGAAFPATATTLVMGGGGGAGTSNNLGPGTGAAGGGMIFIRTGTVSGTGTLSADGAAAACSAQDGAGGGGAGGSVVFFNASGALTGLTVTATGGQGGNADFSGACAVSNSPHGPGGGGAGGVVFASSALNAASSVLGAPSGRTTGNVAYGSTAGTNGSITATLAVTSIPGVQACTVATNASLAGLRVRRGLVEFATTSQRDTLAFQLYGTPDPSGRRSGRALHPRPIPAPLPDTLDAVLYRVPVSPAAGPYLMVEEIETSGRRRMLGPFPVDDAPLREAFERLEARAAEERTRRVRGATVLTGEPLERKAPAIASRTLTPARGAGAFGAKVETRGRGTATVTFAELEAAGLPPGPPESLRVFHLGRAIPHRLLRARGGLPTAIAFEAVPLSTDYTDRSPHVVTRGATPPRPAVPFTRSGPPLPVGWQRAGVNAMYAPFLDLESDPWVWDFLVTGLPTLTKTFALGDLLPGADPVPVRVHFAGSSAHRHVVRVTLNGVGLGSTRFTGRTHGVVEGQIPRALLHATGNELAVDYEVVQPTDPPTETGVAFLDAIDLGAEAAPAAGQLAEVARIAPYDPGLPDLRAIDYLVLTHADFESAAARLAAWHATLGRLTGVVDVERAYDALAGGAFEAQAVRGLLQRLQPESLAVLFGDDTLDPRGYLGLGSVSYVPSLMAWDGQFGRVASENRFADQDGDGAPDLGIGRLPASTAAQAELLVDKIQAGSPAVGPDSTHVIAIDDHGPTDVPFRDVAERIAGSLPLGTPAWVDVAAGIGPARDALFQAWSRGPVAVHYFGHAGVETWADEHLLTPADAGSLGGASLPPLVFTWTCQAQWYQYHLGPSVNEALLLAPSGALATFGPSGISDPGLQALLAERVLARVVKGVPLGDAVRQAKAEALLAHAGMQGVVEGFTLLGDPALVVGERPAPASGREQAR